MDPSTLAHRLRSIVKRQGIGTSDEPVSPTVDEGSRSVHDPSVVLGGEWRNGLCGRCLVIDRRFEADTRHGQTTVGELAARVREAARDAPLLAGGAPARPPFVFFDLETTGLSGGAGTYAFLVGCGWFDDEDAFVTRQCLLVQYGDERELLESLADELSRAGTLVSFNGKSFDAPLLETRYLFHRIEWPAAELPHVDVLHPARRFWGSARGPSRRADLSGPPHRGLERPAPCADSCSLVSLERQVLGARRVADVPGREIPSRYFQFVRTGDARPLVGVLRHNRHDLLALASLTGRLLHLIRVGPGAARDAREALALGRLFWRAGLDRRAREAFTYASVSAIGSQRIEALRSLAMAWRRARQFEQAAVCWRQLLDAGGCPSHIAREASEALAIHYEHRDRDLSAAKAFALQSLGSGERPRWAASVEHRLLRIERKIERGRVYAPQLALTELMQS